MHNLIKIKIFRILLWITYPICLISLYPLIRLKGKKISSLFFFLDRYAIGGAQRVHIDILESVKDKQKTVYFTRKSENDKLKNTFYNIPNTECHDIHFWCDNLLIRLFSVHYFSFFINKHRKAIVLSSNSTFFYDMLPFLKVGVVKIELLHNFSYGKKGMEYFGLANYKYLDKRLVIDAITFQNIIQQYDKYKVAQQYQQRVKLIEFGVDIPLNIIKKPTPPLNILYAGRGTSQKRIWLLNKIAEHFISSRAPVEFTFAGSMESELSSIVKKNCKVLNEIGDRAIMNQLFTKAHVIILTSSFEGFPVVIKEGMSYGCIPIVTALPGNKLHLKHLSNALLIEDINEEDRVVKNAIDNIQLLLTKPELVRQLSTHAYDYAKANFGKQSFISEYKNLLA